MKLNHRTYVWIIQVNFLLMIVLTGLGLYLYPEQYALSFYDKNEDPKVDSSKVSSQYIDGKRNVLKDEILKEKTSKELNLKYQDYDSDILSLEIIDEDSKSKQQSFAYENSKENGQDIINQRLDNSLDKTGQVNNKKSGQKLFKSRAKSIANWASQNKYKSEPKEPKDLKE